MIYQAHTFGYCWCGQYHHPLYSAGTMASPPGTVFQNPPSEWPQYATSVEHGERPKPRSEQKCPECKWAINSNGGVHRNGCSRAATLQAIIDNAARDMAAAVGIAALAEPEEPAIMSDLEVERNTATAIIARDGHKIRVVLRWKERPRTYNSLVTLLFQRGEAELDRRHSGRR